MSLRCRCCSRGAVAVAATSAMQFVIEHPFGMTPGSGAVRVTCPEQFARLADTRRKSIFTWDDPAEKEAAWEKLLTSTTRPIVLVIAPYHSSYYESFRNMEGATAYLAKLDTLPNVTVLDFGKMDLPDAYYQNTTHVNYTGAVEFSKELGRKLKEVLPAGN